jgi:hypothetical protein
MDLSKHKPNSWLSEHSRKREESNAIADFQQAATLAQQQGNQQIYQFAIQNLRRLGAGIR